MKEGIYFVIVLYNASPISIRKLDKALAGFPVIWVCNAHSALESENKKSIKIQNNINKGYAAGSNQGIKLALKKGASWVVLLNQDVVLNQVNVAQLKKTLTNSKPFIGGPFVGLLDKKRWTTILSLAPSSFDYISGSFMILHREALEKVGYFYEPYFMYYEDADLSIRARNKGIQLKRVELINVRHIDGESIGKGSIKHEYYLARNHLLFIERLAPIRVKLHELIRLPLTVCEHLSKADKGGAVGLLHYFFRKFDISSLL